MGDWGSQETDDAVLWSIISVWKVSTTLGPQKLELTLVFPSRFNNPAAMALAKENVSKYYLVVGITEMWDETLEVLEYNLPFFFKGAREMYAKKFKEVRRMSQNFHKGFVSEEIKNIVRANFSREIEFYEFCKERLKLQLSEIRGNQLE